MSTLANFPMKNQLKTVLADGTLDPNHDFDCVSESLAAGLQYLTGKPYEGGQIKEAVYGRNYTGSTAAANYVEYCSLQGCVLSHFDSTDTWALVAEAHKQIQQGHPVIFSEPDPYCLAYERDVLGWTHVCVWYGESPNQLIAMDPFGGFSLAKADAQWASLLRYGQIWILQKKEEELMASISLQDARVTAYYEVAGAMWRCITRGVSYGLLIGNAMLEFYRRYGGEALCGLTYLGLPLSNEISIGQGRTIQFFERGVLCYDPNHTNDNPPGAGAVYLAHLYTGVGQDPRVADLTKQLAALKVAPPVSLAADAATISKLTSGLTEIQNTVKELLA